MRIQLSKIFLTIVTLLSFGIGSLSAQLVLPGYDLFSTQPGTSSDGSTFVGVPLGTYNFGGTTDVQNVGDANAILQRLQSATTTSPTVNIQLDALQLETASPVTMGGGPLGNYFVTLQSADGTGPASTGQMTINLASSTFSSSLDVFYDIHYGALTGQIVQAGNLIVSSSDVLWSNTSPAEAALLNGINNDLNGTDNSADFWTSAFQEQCYSGEPVQIVGTALAAPEPMSWVLAGIGGLFASLLLLRRQRQSA